MTIFKVGSTPDSWNMADAYNLAQDGDAIEFEQDYWYVLPENETFSIQKSLTFIGKVTHLENGTTTYHNGMCGKFVIDGGAVVTLKQLWLSPSGNNPIIAVKNESTINLLTIMLENTVPNYDVCLIVSFNQSTLNFEDIGVKNLEDIDAIKVMKNSKLNIKMSYLPCRLIANHSEITLENVTLDVMDWQVTAIDLAENSSCFLSQCKIMGRNSEDSSIVSVSNSKCTVDNSIIQNTVSLADRSVYEGHHDTVNSFELSDSAAYLNNSTILVLLSLAGNAHVLSTGTLTFMGENDQLVDILLCTCSSLIADTIIINRIANPNIRIKENSFFYGKNLDYPIGSPNDIAIEKQDTSLFITGICETLQSEQEVKTVEEHVATEEPGTAEEKDSDDDKEPAEEKDAMEELNRLIGLQQVKQKIKIMINQVAANKKRIEKGLKPIRQTLHAVFVGNPGTGKTTVARLLGKILFQYGALSGEQFKFIEVSEPDLISQNVGGTAIQTKNYLDQARGGILFIDEAYTLNKKDSSVNFGQEAIDTIMKYMEDYRDEIMVIFAGYTKEMDQFLKTNPGLASRAPNRFVFEDYTADDIVQLGETLLHKDQFVLEDKEYYAKRVKRAYSESLDHSNGRWIRNFNEALTKIQLNRIVVTNTDDIETIFNVDIDDLLNQGRYIDRGDKDDALEQLNRLIGIQNVKRQVREFVFQAEANQKKEEQGIKVGDFTLHSLFLGNPGTGKTTVARLIGKILYQKGIIATNKLIEVSRSDLVAGYIGQTAIKTKEVLESALGGVLFIDEAYTLSSGSENDFGREAIDEILKFMEDHRRDIVIIFAGYTNEMDEFLKTNSGLSSRIPMVFNFEDYSPDELVEIGLLGLKQYHFNQEMYANTVKNLFARSNDHSNGRWIRNFNEKLLRLQASRLIQSGRDDFHLITDEDIKMMEQT